MRFSDLEKMPIEELNDDTLLVVINSSSMFTKTINLGTLKTWLSGYSENGLENRIVEKTQRSKNDGTTQEEMLIRFKKLAGK